MSGECFLAISLILAYTPDCTSLIFSIGERVKYLIRVIFDLVIIAAFKNFDFTKILFFIKQKFRQIANWSYFFRAYFLPISSKMYQSCPRTISGTPLYIRVIIFSRYLAWGSKNLRILSRFIMLAHFVARSLSISICFFSRSSRFETSGKRLSLK